MGELNVSYCNYKFYSYFYCYWALFFLMITSTVNAVPIKITATGITTANIIVRELADSSSDYWSTIFIGVGAEGSGSHKI